MQPKTKKTSAPKRQWLKSQIVLTSILFGLMAPPSAHADEAEEISKLVQQGALDKALARTDAYLANRPKDPQIRFLKGIILAERNRINESIGIFTKLTEDYPELPEPYNNLAVLYAGKGDYDKARESLEMAIRTHPSYATAHENLGDIYAKMASQSYDKALQLDGRNQAAQNKLSMIRNLIAGRPLPESQTLAAQPPTNNTKSKPAESVAQNNRNKTTPEYTQPSSQPVVSSPPVVQEPPKPVAPPSFSTPSTGAGISASKPTTTPPSSVPKEKTTIGGDTLVLAAVERWAKAWSSQDIKTYLDSYSQEFDPPGKINRKSWEKMREDRIVGKESIRVVIENPSITMAGDRAVVKFKQNYYSNKLNNVSMKILNLKLEGGQWRIVSERVGG